MLVVIYAEDIIFLSPFYDAAEHVSTRFQVFKAEIVTVPYPATH